MDLSTKRGNLSSSKHPVLDDAHLYKVKLDTFCFTQWEKEKDDSLEAWDTYKIMIKFCLLYFTKFKWILHLENLLEGFSTTRSKPEKESL